MFNTGKKYDLKVIIITLLALLVVVSTTLAVKGYLIDESELLPFEVEVESQETRYKTGELVKLFPRLIYKGMRPINITTGGNIFLIRIFDEKGFIVYEHVGKLAGLFYHRLEPGVSYTDPMLFIMIEDPYFFIYPSVFKPGKYRVVLWADFKLGKFERWEEKPPEVKVYAKHIFFEIVEP